MNIRQAVNWGIVQLKKAKVDSPELDAELLLIHSFNSPIRANWRIKRMTGRAWLYARSYDQCSAVVMRRFKQLIKRRVLREPVAYIVGNKEFFGLDFLVNKNTLIPRPATETLVEQALDEIRRSTIRDLRSTIIDVGTGSGAIAVALAVELKMKNEECRMFATDVSEAALRIARKNARRHGAEKQIKFLRGNLLEPFFVRVTHYTLHVTRFIIIANLPYLPTAEWRATAPEIKKWEPREALDGGRDGLKYYREMFQQLKKFYILHSSFYISILCEICPHQAALFKLMAKQYFPKAQIRAVKDMSGQERVVKIKFN